nr:MAG TPA: hypothetical protein [Caudoviricetes sp.]
MFYNQLLIFILLLLSTFTVDFTECLIHCKE